VMRLPILSSTYLAAWYYMAGRIQLPEGSIISDH
jgi:hypothetical protein